MDTAGWDNCAHFQSYYKSLLCSFLKRRWIWRKLEGVMSPQTCGLVVNQLHVFHSILGSFPIPTALLCPAPEEVQCGNLHLCALERLFKKTPVQEMLSQFGVVACFQVCTLGLFSSRDSALCSTDFNTWQGIHTCPRIRSLNTWITHMVMWNN